MGYSTPLNCHYHVNMYVYFKLVSSALTIVQFLTIIPQPIHKVSLGQIGETKKSHCRWTCTRTKLVLQPTQPNFVFQHTFLSNTQQVIGSVKAPSLQMQNQFCEPFQFSLKPSTSPICKTSYTLTFSIKFVFQLYEVTQLVMQIANAIV